MAEVAVNGTVSVLSLLWHHVPPMCVKLISK